jgi:hypothetical protein
VVVDPGQDFGLLAVLEQDTADDVHLPQLYPSPLLVLVHEPPHMTIELNVCLDFQKFARRRSGPFLEPTPNEF